MLGAALGDSLGAVLEFDHEITKEKVEHALTLPGGGCWKVGPAQFTDDTELQMSLSDSLIDKPGNITYEQKLNSVAANYIRWIQSHPFDCGGTTARAFSIDPKATNLATRMANNSARCNAVSQANGQLMRVTPIAVWGHKLSEAELVNVARNDALLSHPHQVTQDCAASYCIAIVHLIHHPADAIGAFAKANTWALKHACSEVKQWLAESRGDSAKLDCAWRNIGWVKWGFILAFYHLRLHSDFTDAMRHTLSLGGDCDTNAAIVGGIMGAFWGADRLPKSMLNKLLTYDYDKHGGKKRPNWLSPSHIPEIAQTLFEQAPQKLS